MGLLGANMAYLLWLIVSGRGILFTMLTEIKGTH